MMNRHEVNQSFSAASVVQSGSVFLFWWRDELVSMLPKAIQHKLQYSEHQLVINFSSEGVLLADCKHGQAEASIRLIPDERGELTPEDSRQLLKLKKSVGDSVVIRLDSDHVLSLSFPLPLEAEKNLKEVVGYELGRHAPFKVEQVYFDYYVSERRRNEKKLWVSVTVVPRKQLEPQINMLRLWGIVPTAITVGGNQNSREQPCSLASINLLPVSERGDTHVAVNRLTKVLMLTALFLISTAVSYPFIQQAQQLSAFQARVEAVKKDAVNVQSMKLALEKAAEESAYVEEKKRQYPEVLDVLNMLTMLLPDDTWLEHFEMKEERIRMRGLSADASSLIELLENSPLLQKVSFDSTIVKDPRIERFRFQIVAELAAKEQE